MIKEGYSDAKTLAARVEAMEAWLAKPELLKADADAEYAAARQPDRRWTICPRLPDHRWQY